jgi:hypothetical protein
MIKVVSRNINYLLLLTHPTARNNKLLKPKITLKCELNFFCGKPKYCFDVQNPVVVLAKTDTVTAKTVLTDTVHQMLGLA